MKRRTNLAKGNTMEGKDEEIRELRIKLDSHIQNYNDHRAEYLERQAHQDLVQEQTLQAIQDLTSATKGLVTAWTVASGFNRFVVWVSRFSAIGVALIWLASWYRK